MYRLIIETDLDSVLNELQVIWDWMPEHKAEKVTYNQNNRYTNKERMN